MCSLGMVLKGKGVPLKLGTYNNKIIDRREGRPPQETEGNE